MNKIRILRNEKRLTLRELASKVNMSYSNLGSIERGEVQLREDTAKIFADFFNVSSDYLLGLSDKRNPPSAKEQLSGIHLAFYNQAEELTEAQVKEVLNYIEFVKNRDSKK